MCRLACLQNAEICSGFYFNAKRRGGKNEKREEPKSNASSQEVLVIILTPCGRTDKDIKTEQASRLLLLLYESSPALNLTGTRSH